MENVNVLAGSMSVSGEFLPMDKVIRDLKNCFNLTDTDAMVQRGKGWSVRVFCYSKDIDDIAKFAENLDSELRVEFIAVDKLNRYRPDSAIAKFLLGKKRNLFKLSK